LAKLVASIKKPDAQTTFLAEPVMQGGDVEVDGDDEEMVQKFLDSMELRKINGFGSKTISILTDDMDARSVPYELPLTVSQSRQLLSLGDFTRLYKDQPRLGPRLWGLLHGIDEDPVRPNPEYPKQISVEDSYARTMKRSLGTIRGQMLALMEDLLRRLEDELMDDTTDETGWLLPPPPAVRDEATAAKPTWKRYPRQFRLALRLDWDHPGGRDSKSTIMPAFIFDIARSVGDRADALMSKIGSSLLNELLGIKKGDKVDEKTEFAVYV
jgi:DNA polymerase iota